ncbi:hypothetical protein M5X00_04505 [Paenibacillus alvei]|uniref:Uncharacterized protein n=1 Tax=Paenibacillus alvei TaxID=44250 RepID=A0ABT4GWF2_PAEAL|nr:MULTISPECIES: hypothetical protein [Paenibacillus]MCY9753519.1 hypothetical protein [Paenibacillus alvei]MCY9761041.1 hypothetical protein [Paenibacillus alvei]MCY9767130.1 hypothetical protein [Paenibacillus alvei]GIO82833.1 hypothetical protein J6TS7_64430 [Paenibacillus dendritiformis]
MSIKIAPLSGEHPIDINLRSQLIYGAPSELEDIFTVEHFTVQQNILLSQIGVLEEEAKKAIIERERWNTRFNAMFMELQKLYERHNQLIEKINPKSSTTTEE